MTANPKKRPAASPTQGNVRKRPAGAARNPAAAAPVRSEGADASGIRAWADGLNLGPDDGETAKVGTGQYFATKAFRLILSTVRIAAQEALQEGFSVYVCVS
jgi:hypothetical protein